MKEFRCLFLLLPLLISSVFTASGQTQSRVYTLDDAISVAQEQSPDALSSRQTFRASFWDYRSFRASYLPSMAAYATTPDLYRAYKRYENPDGSVDFIQQQYVGLNGNLNISQVLGFSGGMLSLGSGLEGVGNFTDSTLDKSYSANIINIGLNQPLFQFNPYRWDRKIKPLEYEQAKKKFLEDIEQISITTTNYFFNLLSAQIDKKIAQTNMSNYDTLFRIAKGRYELGKIAENELLSLELNYLRAQADVENAKINLDMALFRFRSYLRIKDTIPIMLVPPGTISFFTVNPVDAVGLAKTNSSTYLDYQRRLLEAEKEVRRSKMDGRFDANLNANFGLAKDGPTVPEAYTHPNDQEMLALGLSIPIYDWGVARGKIKVAEAQQEIVRNAVEQERLDFERNIFIKVLQFNMQENLMRIAAKSDTVARKTYEVVKGRYLIGKPVTILELNDAQINTDNSEKNYYNALLTFWRSYYELRKLTLFDFRQQRPIQFNMADIGL